MPILCSEVVAGGAACGGADDDSCALPDTAVPDGVSSVVMSLEITAWKREQSP